LGGGLFPETLAEVRRFLSVSIGVINLENNVQECYCLMMGVKNIVEDVRSIIIVRVCFALFVG
jgi:hypothetical protein